VRSTDGGHAQCAPDLLNVDLAPTRGEIDMAKGEQRSNREKKKPKKEKIKASAAAPSQKTGGWQPTQDTGKKK
jgi:hypothetical protein